MSSVGVDGVMAASASASARRDWSHRHANRVQKLRDRLRQMWLERRGDPVAALLHDLNPVIRGWANYFRIGVASDTFAALDSWMYTRAYRHAKFRHPKQSRAWRQRRYWGKLHPRRDDRWVFGDP